MICSKCVHWHHRDTPIRMTPTFYHSPIFDPYESAQRPNTRCSATYHSTVFDGAQIHRPSKCCCKQPRKSSAQKTQQFKRTSASKNGSRCNSGCKFRRQAQLHPHPNEDLNRLSSRGVSHHDLLWCNPDKQVKLMNCSNCSYHGLSKQRKLIELQSNPFYPEEYVRVNQEISNKNCRCIDCRCDNCQCEQRVEVMRNSCPCGPSCCCQNQKLRQQQLNNDSLEVMNQKNQPKAVEQDLVFDQPTFGRQEQPIMRQTVEKPVPVVPKKQNRHKKGSTAACVQKRTANQINKLNTIDCSKTVKRSNPNKGPSGQPMFWAITKSNVRK